MASKSRLTQAAEATQKLFSVNDGEPEAVSEAAQTVKTPKTTRSKAKAVEPVKEASKVTKGEAVIFSVRADADAVAEWKAYAKAKTGASMASVVDAAMAEYMKRHKLTEAEMGIYDFELKKADFLKHYKP